MVSLSSMQVVFAESLLRKQEWRNRKNGRVGCLHQNIYTRKVTEIAFIAIIIHIPRPRVPVPHVPTSHTWWPQVPSLEPLSPKSPRTRPNVPVPLSLSRFYTQPSDSDVVVFNTARISNGWVDEMAGLMLYWKHQVITGYWRKNIYCLRQQQ